MKAAVFHGVGDIRVEDVPEPATGPREAVVEVDYCGICGSDLHSFEEGALVGPGQVMGHEFSGRVVVLGAEVEGLALGDRVTAVPITPCDGCARCAEGRYNLCQVAWGSAIAYGRPGAFAERVAIPRAEVGVNVFKLDGLDARAGATVEPLAVAVHAVRKVGDVHGTTALVLGLGMIGQQVAQVLLARGAARVIGLDLSPKRLEIARGLGVDARDGGPGVRDVLREALGEGEEIDTVFECSGVPALLSGSLRSVRAGGSVCILALYGEGIELDPNRLVHKEIVLLGSMGFTSPDFALALRLLQEGRAVATPLITEVVPLSDIAGAFESQLAKDSALKVLVEPGA
jgi:2-desacetyl-2-hydroxyethyl bacteriochlorophyllide A dehydrogenase